MLDSDTKRRIDSARQILVGKVPDPKGQVEQITTALIYKFMDDMDKEAQELGGEVKFFTGEYEKYAWSRLMDPRLGGQARLNLYTEALAQLWQNKNLPALFQQIFKSSFLPFRDPETLNLFLKEINGFVYDHSERLGDSYEYLLNVLGTQGDAGQFRTPRHIIDFIVEAVNPTKDDTILDPACGTAGFLISAFKHILKQNTEHKRGDTLTPDEKRALMSRFTGYDISPDMVRLSLVNMYLHGFPLPNIVEYDTLGQEERWDDSFNVILANPPFMTPKGGVMPHKRFSVQASRSEVLFVDYIADHLTPNGRAGVIVPEGIIFQSGNAYKQLRKMLVEGYLYAVISLPAGAFNPYSGVKTSVLLMDKNIAKRSKEIAFIKVENDGFDLGAQRRTIVKNDLPQALEILKLWKEGKKTESPLSVFVEKAKIMESGDYNLSGDRYRVAVDYSNAKWPMVALGKVAEILNGYAFKSENYIDSGIRIIRITNVQKGLVIDDNPKFYPVKSEEAVEKFKLHEDDLLLSLTGNVGRVGLLPNTLLPAALNQRVACLRINEDKINRKFLFFLLNQDCFENDCIAASSGAAQKNLSTIWLSKYKIPLPPFEVQQQIVEELDGYQKIISGARQVVENWKPHIDIHPEWEKVKLGEIAEYFIGLTYSPEDVSDKGTIVLRSSNIQDGELDFSDIVRVRKKIKENLIVKDGDILMCSRNGSKRLVGKIAVIKNLTEEMTFGTFMTIIRSKYNQFLSYFFVSGFFRDQIDGSETSSINQITKYMLDAIVVPLPPLAIQKQIVDKIETERTLVEGNKKLIEVYEGKMKERIGRVWGEPFPLSSS